MPGQMYAIYPPGQSNYFTVCILISPMSEEIFQGSSCYFIGEVTKQTSDLDESSCLFLPNLLILK